MQEQNQMTVLDVGILILEAVAVLHARGHQLLRILPGMSGSGLHWRTAITTSDNLNSDVGYLHVRNMSEAFVYSTGSTFEVAGERVDEDTSVDELADRILSHIPGDSVGQDWTYSGWYVQLMGQVRRHHQLPVAYADYFDDERGWEIGWGRGVRVPGPPDTTAPHPAEIETKSLPYFYGTVADFKRHTGAHWREVVQKISKNHKAAIGECQHCGTTEPPFDAAHVHGRERVTLIHSLLGSSDPKTMVEIQLGEFETRFKAEHVPVEKTSLVLCPACHTAYDASPAKTPAAAPAIESAGVEPGEPILPITLEPRGVDAFRAALLATRKAHIDVAYADGHVERMVWNAENISETSNILGNLRSRPQFRKGQWQEEGIVAVHVSVA